jgi:hypothetical protein
MKSREKFNGVNSIKFNSFFRTTKIVIVTYLKSNGHQRITIVGGVGTPSMAKERSPIPVVVPNATMTKVLRQGQCSTNANFRY